MPDNLELTAWEVLRMTFWSQVSFTPKEPLYSTCSFDKNTQALRALPFFGMLDKRPALSKKGYEQ